MFQSQTRSRSTCDIIFTPDVRIGDLVSISDEKPLHMRRALRGRDVNGFACFNLRREAAPHATGIASNDGTEGASFQSQTRSRSTCDLIDVPGIIHTLLVSISDEKPLHMRRIDDARQRLPVPGFNLRREAAPHATKTRPMAPREMACFNLRREAAPHATSAKPPDCGPAFRFQSQTRSRSTCDI